MKKDKTYELRIEEDDLISGIDSISLVSEPAIEINWMAFNKEKSHEFQIPDGEDKTYLQKFEGKGQSEEELLSQGWEVYEEPEKFFTSSPNAPSFEDTDEFLYRYKYTLNPEAPGAPIKDTTREFCADLLNKNLVYRVEDMDSIINDEGDSALVWRGGYNCRHSWKLLKYRKGDDIVNKGSVTKGRVEGVESYDVIGYPQPDTRTSNPSFSKEEMEYDNNLPVFVDEGVEKVKCKECGWEWELSDGGEKPYMCNKCGNDNKPEKEDFRSYTDYPIEATNNAKRALKWVDENGWGECGTPVGKQRANQLAARQSISEETISRMASFARHRQHKDVPYSEGCGGLMWDAWGGTAGIEWAQRKLQQIDREKQEFAIDSEEKRIVVGPAMLPDLNIPRVDSKGNKYSVFFTEKTIRMIAEKYMRNKYIDNNDTDHNGEAAKDVYVIESWIVEDPEHDKSKNYGFSVRKGTWMVAMKVRNDEVWQKIKNKELNGFSVSGYFEEVAQFCKEEMFLKEVAEILKKY
jgi:hypothetical protein